MKILITRDKALVACTLANIKGTELGYVRVKQQLKGLSVDLEIIYPDEAEENIQQIQDAIDSGATMINVRRLLQKYKYIDQIVGEKVRNFKRENRRKW
jgi:hypothetical protein